MRFVFRVALPSPGCDRRVPGKVEVPLGSHALCRALPAAGGRARCGDSGPGDTGCLVLLGDVLAAARHRVNTGDR